MGFSAADVERLMKAIRYDLTAAQRRVTELGNALAEVLQGLPEPTQHLCPACGLGFTTEGQLTDHRRNVHGELWPGEISGKVQPR